MRPESVYIVWFSLKGSRGWSAEDPTFHKEDAEWSKNQAIKMGHRAFIQRIGIPTPNREDSHE